MKDDPNLWEKIATPTRFGEYIGKDVFGRPYTVYPWTQYVEARVIDAVLDPDPRGIILNVPPQEGKSTFSGLLLPTWYLGMWPHHMVFFIAYAEEYASSWGGKARDLMARYGQELFGVGVSKSQATAGFWNTSQGIGGMASVGILGQITGRPGNLIVIDDVLSTMEDASSAATKRKHEEQYDGAITTRFQEGDPVTGEPGTTVLITATRFADDDLSGRLIERQEQPGYDGERFEVISIPALAEPEDDEELTDEEKEEWRDFLGRRIGEGLTCRHSERWFKRRKASLKDPFTWSALYQQRPSVRAGGMFPSDKWRRWTEANLPTLTRTIRVWDLATTDGAGDWTVGSKFGLGTNGDLYLLDRQRVRYGPDGVERLVMDTARGDGYLVDVLIEQEKAGAGKALVEVYRSRLAGYNVKAAKIDGSKEVRASPYSAMQRVGRVWLPADQEQMCKEWIDEHSRMMGDGRRPRHDDQIDTGAYATLELLGGGATEMWIPGEDVDDGASSLFAPQATIPSRVERLAHRR